MDLRKTFVFSKSEPPWSAYTLGCHLGYVAIMYLDCSVVKKMIMAIIFKNLVVNISLHFTKLYG
jgi:hypothetical protein